MISLNDIGIRFRAIQDITLGDASQLHRLDISQNGFKASFQALIVALVPFFLQWVLITQAQIDIPGDMNRAGLLGRAAFIDLCQWIIPLMIFIAFSGLMGLRDRVIAFIVAYNWGKAFIAWLYAPFVTLKLIVPGAYILHWLTSNLLMVVVIFILYRLFQAALNKKNSYMLPFMILYGIVNIFVFLVSLEIVGWSPFRMAAEM